MKAVKVGFLARFRRAQTDAIRADERRRIVVALRHHGHARNGTDFYEAADFIERRFGVACSVCGCHHAPHVYAMLTSPRRKEWS